MKREYVTCDVCGCRVDYTDSGFDSYVSGFTFYNYNEDDMAKQGPTEINISMHQRTRSGYSGTPLPGLRLENVCSPVCLRKVFVKWLDDIDAKTLYGWLNGEAVPNEVVLGDRPKVMHD